jgi:hypothetical protein
MSTSVLDIFHRGVHVAVLYISDEMSQAEEGKNWARRDAE